MRAGRYQFRGWLAFSQPDDNDERPPVRRWKKSEASDNARADAPMKPRDHFAAMHATVDAHNAGGKT